jgi:hypothetical protein
MRCGCQGSILQVICAYVGDSILNGTLARFGTKCKTILSGFSSVFPIADFIFSHPAVDVFIGCCCDDIFYNTGTLWFFTGRILALVPFLSRGKPKNRTTLVETMINGSSRISG